LRFEDLRLARLEDLRLARFEDLRLARFEDLRLAGFEDLQFESNSLEIKDFLTYFDCEPLCSFKNSSNER
jgi:hypothetical protein